MPPSRTARRKVSKSGSSRRASILDITSKGMMGKLEKMMKKMTVVLVLVYADWCPHCHTYKKDVWSKVKAMHKKHKGKKVGIAAVNEKVLKDSPVSSAKINGYPSLLLLGKDGKLAEFKDEAGQATNALPNSKDMGMLSGIIKGDEPDNYSEPQNVDESPGNATVAQAPSSSVESLADASATATNSASPVAAENSASSVAAESSAPNDVAPNHIMASPSSAELLEPDSSRPLTEESEEKMDATVDINSLSQPAANGSSVLPPSAEDDLLSSQESQESQEPSGPQNSSQLGGSLYMALLEAAKATAPAAALTAAATVVSRRTKKLSRKRSGKSSRRR